MASRPPKLINKKEDDIGLGISLFQNDIIKILRMNPIYRKEDEIQRMVDFLNYFEVFQGVELSESFKLLCKNSEYRFVEQGNFVFEQGDMPEYFYILIKGEVAGSVKKIEGAQNKFFDEVDMIFKLHYGQGFGEKALIDNIPRTASLVATKASHLMLVPREDYLRTIQSHHVQQSLQNAQLLSEIRLFDNFTEKQKQHFASFCYLKTLPLGHCCIRQDDEVTKVILIKLGMVDMFRNIRLESLSERVVRKYQSEISKTVFPIRFHLGFLGNGDYIGVHELFAKKKMCFEYVVQLPSRILEISVSDLVKQGEFVSLLNFDEQKNRVPDDDLLVQEYFERRKWTDFQKCFSQKVVFEKKMNEAQESQAKMTNKLNRINARIRRYMDDVKTNLPLIATSKNHVALYEILNRKNKDSRHKLGLGLNQIMFDEI